MFGSSWMLIEKGALNVIPGEELPSLRLD